MFNWFRRQMGNVAPEVPTPVVTPETASEQESESPPEATTATTETSEQEAYLTWAKEAYKNIQQRKAETLETSENQEVIAAASPESEVAPVEESVSAEIEVVPVVETSAPLDVDQSEAGPAWLKKSDRLEVLKETAIETPIIDAPLPQETGAIDLDEDFLWSAKVLAAQGRSAQDISEAEINWLGRLRQGLTKTRRNLVNQLKAIVGQGPLNQEAVMEIEALLLQADVGVEATDHIIETLQNKLKEEALPPEQAIDYLKQILRDILDRPFQDCEETAFVPEKDILNIWLLTGVNGAGKTTTISALIQAAQIEHFEGSPTFAIIQSYVSPSKGKIFHLDCYRIENETDLLNLGLEELFEQKAVFFVEWSEKIEQILLSNRNIRKDLR
jgi:fused signal recognition particle receptor